MEVGHQRSDIARVERLPRRIRLGAEPSHDPPVPFRPELGAPLVRAVERSRFGSRDLRVGEQELSDRRIEREAERAASLGRVHQHGRGSVEQVSRRDQIATWLEQNGGTQR